MAVAVMLSIFFCFCAACISMHNLYKQYIIQQYKRVGENNNGN